MAANRTKWLFADEEFPCLEGAEMELRRREYADQVETDKLLEGAANDLFADYCAERGIDPADLADVDVDDEEFDSFYW